MKVNDKNVGELLIKARYELICATDSRPDAYTRMKIEKVISMIDTLITIIEFE
jgi:hypothetical protein